MLTCRLVKRSITKCSSHERNTYYVQTKNAPRGYAPKIPSKPCTQCRGTGRDLCQDCNGRGRINYTSLHILPEGVSPQWCRSCRGSGLWYCEKCMGTGIKRGKIGLQLE